MAERLDKRQGLRRGFTTGACAAAAAKAAAIALFSGRGSSSRFAIGLTLPVRNRVEIMVLHSEVRAGIGVAAVVKDAGDDPDVTNNALIIAEVSVVEMRPARRSAKLLGGEGVGVVTKPGLKVGVGEPAINPAPRRMIRRAVYEAAEGFGLRPAMLVKVCVQDGRRIAAKTMNERLGIVGGISILGTTGIVEPLSLVAYKDSITSAISVASACSSPALVLSTGRSTEKVMQRRHADLPAEAFILVGDHMGFALSEAAVSPIRDIIVAGQFGKFCKLACGQIDTHCSKSAVELAFLARICAKVGRPDVCDMVVSANTAREVYFCLRKIDRSLFKAVADELCAQVVKMSTQALGRRARAVLVGFDDDLVAEA